MKKISLLSLLALACLTGCYEEECGINAEPVITLAFPLNFTGPPLIFDRIRILNSIKNITNAEISIGAKNYPNDLFLPVDLRTNSTTYIFERNNRTDTLTVFYQQKIYDVNKRCGYILDLEAPISGPQFRSTFKRAKIDYYSYYSYQEGITRYEPLRGIFFQIFEL
jgi:hypothetical protein